MICLRCSINKFHTVTKLFCFIYEVRSINGDKLDFFLVLKYIIFVNIIKNFTDVIVPGFILRYHCSCPIMWHVFSIQISDAFYVSGNASSTYVVD